MIEIEKEYQKLIKGVAKRYELKMKYSFRNGESYGHCIEVNVKNQNKTGMSLTMVSKTPMTLNAIENDINWWLNEHRPEHLRKIKIKSLQASDD